MTHWILGLLEFAHAVSSPQMLIVRKDLIAAATETSEPATEEQYSFLTESRTSPMKSLGSVLEQSSEAQRVGGTKTSIQCQTYVYFNHKWDLNPCLLDSSLMHYLCATKQLM